MAYSLRYYKEFTHADGKVVRLEIHKKDSTAGAIEIGNVVQGLSLQIQGSQGDVDTPIVKTSLSMTFNDAYDLENGQKNGFWEEFYTPDSVLWMVVVKAKNAQENAFSTIWGGYVTPDSFSETLTYRGSVNIIARDNIGHMQDFPFDATGDEDGMISLFDLVTQAWAKIESPMDLLWNGLEWQECEGVIAYNTLMNVSAFEGLNWYEAVEKALYSYGAVMRYVGGNEVIVTTLRYMPYQGGDIDALPKIEPRFVTGATRELVPAVKRIEESVDYELEESISQPQIKVSDFSGSTETYRCKIDGVNSGSGSFGTLEHDAPIWSINNTENWANTAGKSLFFNPHAYEIGYFSNRRGLGDEIKRFMYIAANNVDERSVSFSKTITCADLAIRIKFGQPVSLNSEGSSMAIEQQNVFNLKSIRYSVSLVQNGVTNYLASHGGWVVDKQEITTEFDTSSQVSDFECLIGMGEFIGQASLTFTIHKIEYAQMSYANLADYGLYACIQDFAIASPSTMSLLEKNAVNTNYQDGNNVILSRDPEIGPAYNTVVLPAFIKNGIFYRDSGVIYPASRWAWAGGTPQQMAVYNHLQLLAYYAKPNNLISGTIVNADITRLSCIYDWNRTEHILISGNINLLRGHIEGAVLREFTRYEYLWADVEGAGFPATEQNSKSNIEGGAAKSNSSTTYGNTTNVNIGTGGGGGGASYLGDLQDVDVTGVVAQSVLYYNGTSWVDMSFASLVNPLLNPYLKSVDAEATYATKNALSGVENAVSDNAGNIKKNFDAIEALTTRVKAEEDITATYKSWWDDLMGLIVKDGNDIKIKTNLIVAGDTSSEGTGTNPEVVGTLIGIKVNGQTYDKPVNGILTIPDYPTSLEWSAINGKPTKLSEFLNDSGFITSAALVGYATQSWVESRNYITGIDKSMVASAVGASGNAGKVLSSTGGDLGWISLPTSLPASDVYAWAKAATKPSYTKAEVGLGNVENKSSATIRGEITATNVTNALGYTPANNDSLANYLPLSGGTLTGGLTISSGNFIMSGSDTVTKQLYAIADNTYALGTGSRRWSNIHTLLINGGTPIHSGNIGSQSVLSAQQLAHSNGTVGAVVNSSGNVLIGTTTDSGYKLDVSGVIKNTSYIMSPSGLFVGSDYSQRLTNGLYAGNLMSSALTAADLYLYSTSKLLLYGGGGVAITGAVTMSSTLSVATSVTTPLLKSAGGLDIVANGSAAGSRLFLTSNCFRPWGDDAGLIDLGASYVQWRNVYAVNAIFSGDTATGSDIRFKDIKEHLVFDLETMANAPLFAFTWNDRNDNEVHIGGSAQYWQGVRKELVRGEEFLAMNYTAVNYGMGVSLAKTTLNHEKRLNTHEERIKILERENEQLKEQIRRIRYGS